MFLLIPLNIAVTPTIATAVDICPFNSEVHGAGPGNPTPLDTLVNGRGVPNGQVTPAELYGSRLPLTAVTGEIGDIEGECGLIQATLNPMQNVIMSISQGIASFVIGIYRWATNPEVLGFMLEPVDCLVGGRATGAQGCNGDGLSGTLFLQFLSIAVMAGAVYMGYRGLVKKRSRDAFQAAIWMIACTGLALVFMAQPSWFVVKANEAVAAVSNIMTRATTSVVANAGNGITMCDLSAGRNTDTRSASCHLWRVLVYEPWRSAQFPGSGSRPIPIEDDATREYIMAKFPQLGDAANDLTLAHIDSTLTDAIELNTDGYEPQADRDRFEAVRAQAAEAKWVSGWAGRDTGDRFLGGIMSLIAGVLGGALIAVFAFMSLVYNVTLLILVVVSPVVALLGVFPGTRRIAIKWLEMFVGTVMKRLVLAVVLAVLMGFYSLIAATNMNWLAKIILVCVLGIAAFMLRKPLASAIRFGQAPDMENAINRPGGAMLAGGVGAVTTLLSGGGVKDAVASAGSAVRRRYPGVGGPVAGPISEGVSDGRARGQQRSESQGSSPTRPERPSGGKNNEPPSEPAGKTTGGNAPPRPTEDQPTGNPQQGTGAPAGAGGSRREPPVTCPKCGSSVKIVGNGLYSCPNCHSNNETPTPGAGARPSAGANANTPDGSTAPPPRPSPRPDRTSGAQETYIPTRPPESENSTDSGVDNAVWSETTPRAAGLRPERTNQGLHEDFDREVQWSSRTGPSGETIYEEVMPDGSLRQMGPQEVQGRGIEQSDWLPTSPPTPVPSEEPATEDASSPRDGS